MLNYDVVRDGISSQQDKAELVVVGSLIDDVASLGGLARSCEIFNVSRLILGESVLPSLFLAARSRDLITTTFYEHLCIVRSRSSDPNEAAVY